MLTAVDVLDGDTGVVNKKVLLTKVFLLEPSVTVVFPAVKVCKSAVMGVCAHHAGVLCSFLCMDFT